MQKCLLAHQLEQVVGYSAYCVRYLVLFVVTERLQTELWWWKQEKQNSTDWRSSSNKLEWMISHYFKFY